MPKEGRNVPDYVQSAKDKAAFLNCFLWMPLVVCSVSLCGDMTSKEPISEAAYIKLGLLVLLLITVNNNKSIVQDLNKSTIEPEKPIE